MGKRPLFYVKKRTLLAVAGCVWLVAGFNVARLGVLSYQKLSSITAIHILLSLIVFCPFGIMFFKMSRKHAKRIKGYEEESRPMWHFFDLKAYLIMATMMGGGIWPVSYTHLQSEAIMMVQKALADSLKMLNEANPTDQVLALKSLEAFQKAADGQATKIIIPSEIQSLAGLATSFKEVMTDVKK